MRLRQLSGAACHPEVPPAAIPVQIGRCPVPKTGDYFYRFFIDKKTKNWE
jgi:hypothetical protein